MLNLAAMSMVKHATASLAKGCKKPIKKFVVRNYEMIHLKGHLPYKNTQQLYTMAQRVIGLQAIMPYSGILLDPDVVARDNQLRFGIDYFIQRTRIESLTWKF